MGRRPRRTRGVRTRSSGRSRRRRRSSTSTRSRRSWAGRTSTAFPARVTRSSARPNPNRSQRNSEAGVSHVLVIANETAASSTLLDTLRTRAEGDDVSVTVIAPVSEPQHGYVVYEDTRRASAGRRLERTLELLRQSSIPAQGFVVETSPVQAAKDALAQLEPTPDEIVVSTH